MSQETSHRIWAILGIGAVTVAGLGLLLAFLGRGSLEPGPTVTSALPIPSDDPVVANIVIGQDARSITHASWQEAVLLDQVMSGLSGQPAPAPDETLQRLINEELVLQAHLREHQPTAEQVEGRIAELEQAWSVDDTAVTAALEAVGLTHLTLEQAVARLLAVEASLGALQSQGYDTTAWLEEQRTSAQIQIFETTAASVISTPRSPIPTPFASAPPAATIRSPLPSPSPMPASDSPPPTPALAIPEVAPDFTLQRAGGSTLTLSEQLAQGPVVLVFFQRGG